MASEPEFSRDPKSTAVRVGPSTAVTATNSTDVINLTAHGFANGDEVRFINASGTVYARAEVVTVTDALTLTLSRKVTVTPGDRFEVYLKVPPAPHEQSNEELLGYATDKVLSVAVSPAGLAQGIALIKAL